MRGKELGKTMNAGQLVVQPGKLLNRFRPVCREGDRSKKKGLFFARLVSNGQAARFTPDSFRPGKTKNMPKT
jgi:hypothetical protein